MTENDILAARRIPLEAFNEGKLEVIDEVIAPDFSEHQPSPGYPNTREGLKSLIIDLRKAFPDFKYTVIEEISQGDRLVVYMTAKATMTGDFMGMKASGKTAEWEEMHLMRMQNGKIIDHWGVMDALSMMQQLGFVPMPEELTKAA